MDKIFYTIVKTDKIQPDYPRFVHAVDDESRFETITDAVKKKNTLQTWANENNPKAGLKYYVAQVVILD